MLDNLVEVVWNSVLQGWFLSVDEPASVQFQRVQILLDAFNCFLVEVVWHSVLRNWCLSVDVPASFQFQRV